MIHCLDPANPCAFPDPGTAEPEGLLAVGGDLSPERLLTAYSRGIFPWYGPGDPLLWWSPDPRCVILPEDFRVPRTVRREIRASPFTITVDQAFSEVIAGCAGVPRRDRDGGTSTGTWIVEEMRAAYIRLHELGFAHSVEAWDEHGLAGGLYGVSLGRAFFGESMFHIRPNASKIALATFLSGLWEQGCELVDCEMETPHILRYGARNLPRDAFLRRLAHALEPAHAADVAPVQPV